MGQSPGCDAADASKKYCCFYWLTSRYMTSRKNTRSTYDKSGADTTNNTAVASKLDANNVKPTRSNLKHGIA
jgi:hypothetical protein